MKDKLGDAVMKDFVGLCLKKLSLLKEWWQKWKNTKGTQKSAIKHSLVNTKVVY